MPLCLRKFKLGFHLLEKIFRYLINEKVFNLTRLLKNNEALNPKESSRLFPNDLIWLGHDVDLIITAGKKMDKYYSVANLSTLYKAQI